MEPLPSYKLLETVDRNPQVEEEAEQEQCHKASNDPLMLYDAAKTVVCNACAVC